MRRIWRGIVRWAKKARRKVPLTKKKTPIRQAARPEISAVARALSVKPEHFRIERVQGWAYDELHPHPTGSTRFLPVRSNDPHLVLRDKSGVARFTLSYSETPHAINLHYIQRSRTVNWVWGESDARHAARETQASKEFQRELNGVHPSEFLLIQFLREHHAKIAAGTAVFWHWLNSGLQSSAKINILYRGLADRYFKRVKDFDGVSLWRLNLNKSRTREVLGLPALKK